MFGGSGNIFGSILKAQSDKETSEDKLFGMPPIPSSSSSPNLSSSHVFGNSFSFPSKKPIESEKQIQTKSFFESLSHQNKNKAPFVSSSSASSEAEPFIFQKPETKTENIFGIKASSPFNKFKTENESIDPNSHTPSYPFYQNQRRSSVFELDVSTPSEKKSTNSFGTVFKDALSKQSLSSSSSSYFKASSSSSKVQPSNPFRQLDKSETNNKSSLCNIFGTQTRGEKQKKEKTEDEENFLDLGSEAERDENEREGQERKTKTGRQEDKKEIKTKGLESHFSKKEYFEIKSIVCESIPEIACKSSILEKHFSRFGSLLQVVVDPSTNSAIVRFEDHKSAKKAKDQGHCISQKIPPIGAIFYSKKSSLGPFKRLNSLETTSKTESQEELKSPYSHSTPSILLTKVCFSDQDFFEVLDARDKRLRESRNALSSQRALEGLCPDMCPETERYSRSAKNQLRFYEKINGVIHHYSVTKEYSRSSADQELPLRHELRSGAVLSRTMSHVLHNVIDRIDYLSGSMAEWYEYLKSHGSSKDFYESERSEGETIGDWFEYVWSTTRSIRKDLTQQHLTNLTAVNLVEKSTRFHIMASGRLVEADSHDFSPKLNDENLTKCLQSLKHLYYDLSLDGVPCPNEPEFRAYDILMNLNDGQTLKSLQTLSYTLVKDSRVTLALHLFNAIYDNNYSRFFKLVKEASLLEACILLRYFFQVRQRALETIVKAYCPPKVLIPFSLFVLRRILGFESNEDCRDFCFLHGLEAHETDETVIMMERSYFVYPDSVPQTKRHMSLIESKRGLSLWSEVINGGPLEEPNPYYTYIPHSSFANGVLRHEAWSAEDQGPIKEEKEKGEKSSNPLSTDQILKSSTNFLEKLVQECMMEVCQDVLLSLHGISCTEFILENDFLPCLLKETLNETLKEMTRKESLIEKNSISFYETLEESVRKDLIHEVLGQVYKDEYTRFNSALISLESHLFEEVLRESLISIASELFKQEKYRVSQERREAFTLCRKKQTLRVFFDFWRRALEKSKRRRETLSNFPSLPSSKSLQSINIQLKGPSFSKKKSSHSQTTQILFQVIDLTDDILEGFILEPIHVHSLLSSSRPDLKNWKCIICGPDLDSSSPSRLLVEMLKRKLRTRPLDKEDANLLSVHHSVIKGNKISICIRFISFDELKESDIKRKVQGVSAFLFLHVLSESSSSESLIRLLESKSLKTSIPLVVLSTLDDESTRSLQENCISYYNSGSISSFEISLISPSIFDSSTLLALTNSLTSLVLKSSSDEYDKHNLSVSLTIKPLKDFVEDFLRDHFYKDLSFDIKLRKGEHRSPNVLIETFNSLVSCMKSHLTNPMYKDFSLPIPEFHESSLPVYWNSSEYYDLILSSLNTLFLPYPFFSPSTTSTTNESSSLSLSSHLFSYFESLFKDKEISKELKLMYASRLHYQFLQVSSSSIPWTEVVTTLIEAQIEKMPLVDSLASSSLNETQIIVGYVKENSECSQSWRKENQKMTFESSSEKETPSRFDWKEELKDSSTFEKKLRTLIEIETIVPYYRAETMNKSDSLNQPIESLKEKTRSIYFEDDSSYSEALEESRAFERKLHRALNS